VALNEAESEIAALEARVGRCVHDSVAVFDSMAQATSVIPLPTSPAGDFYTARRRDSVKEEGRLFSLGRFKRFWIRAFDFISQTDQGHPGGDALG
jgi:hypothetical protein